ncbi:SRPBCC family protein [Arthrobacter sp. H14-L1]|uniref:SRPBCC family protein n=1 Tax=Arthrobacter sp. H14-L1 TaxID=2996697 RepID=UPI0022713CF7|nr:SRPBCC family protein [Arthrobacter sp. H14-L1]MCY0905979.1 SRPBCC family protein [Arthrobacter sp. H14-L1]
MVDIQNEIHIRVRRADVAAYAGNPDNASKWYTNIASARWLTQPPVRIGSQVAFSARFLGRTLDYTYEFMELVPEEMLVMRTSHGPFPMKTTYTWSDAGDGTIMTLRNNGEPREFSVLAGALMAPMMRRAMRKDLAKLKSILETGLPPM